jgi:hypothetical protein
MVTTNDFNEAFLLILQLSEKGLSLDQRPQTSLGIE